MQNLTYSICSLISAYCDLSKWTSVQMGMGMGGNGNYFSGINWNGNLQSQSSDHREWEWEWNHGNGREWYAKSYSRTSLLLIDPAGTTRALTVVSYDSDRQRSFVTVPLRSESSDVLCTEPWLRWNRLKTVSLKMPARQWTIRHAS